MAAMNEKKPVIIQGTHEVELIVKKKSVLDFTDETHDDNKEIIEEYVRFYFFFCNECEKIREVEYNVMTLNLQTL